MGYEVVTVNLGVTGRVACQRPGAAVTSVLVLSAPAGTTAALRIGEMGQDVPLVTGLEWEPDECAPDELTGVFVNVPTPPPGGVAQVIVVSGDGGRFSQGN